MQSRQDTTEKYKQVSEMLPTQESHSSGRSFSLSLSLDSESGKDGQRWEYAASHT